MDIIEMFAQLPAWVEIEGCTFELKLIVNGSPDDVRLVYMLTSCEEGSRHYENFKDYGSWENPLRDGSGQGFAFLREGISNQWDLASAISSARAFFSLLV